MKSVIGLLVAAALSQVGTPDAGVISDAGVPAKSTKPRVELRQVTVCTIYWPDGGVQQDASTLCEALRQL